MSKKRVRTYRRLPRRAAPNEHQLVRCRICHRYFRQISWTHLRKEHGMGVDEYKEMFGLQYVYSDGLRSLTSEVRVRWTREVVIERLRARRRRRRSLAYMKVERDDRNLAHAATRLFGSYEAAVRAAGFDYRNLYPLPNQRVWTDDRILKMIRQYHREKRPLNTGSIRKYDRALYTAAERHMGSWALAIERAGISYESIRRDRRPRWTNARVIQALRRHYRRKNPGRLPNEITCAAKYRFGSMAKARQAAGLVARR